MRAVVMFIALFVGLFGAEVGGVKWKFPTQGNIWSSPAIADDGTIYVGSDDNYLYAINPDGSLKWKFQTQNMIRSSPAIADDGTIYVGSHDDNFYAIEGSAPLMNSAWPKFRHNQRNTGNTATQLFAPHPKHHRPAFQRSQTPSYHSHSLSLHVYIQKSRSLRLWLISLEIYRDFIYNVLYTMYQIYIKGIA